MEYFPTSKLTCFLFDDKLVLSHFISVSLKLTKLDEYILFANFWEISEEASFIYDFIASDIRKQELIKLN